MHSGPCRSHCLMCMWHHPGAYQLLVLGRGRASFPGILCIFKPVFVPERALAQRRPLQAGCCHCPRLRTATLGASDWCLWRTRQNCLELLLAVACSLSVWHCRWLICSNSANTLLLLSSGLFWHQKLAVNMHDLPEIGAGSIHLQEDAMERRASTM